MMKFVDENVIDEIIDALEALDDAQYDAKMAVFAEEQPVMVAYLFDEENFHLLTEDEKGFLQYLCLIAYLAIRQVNGASEPVSEEMIGEAEEKNYAVLEESTGSTFRDRLTPFFDEYPQEDLLAFIEDAVLEDEDEQDALVTKEGREPIFIAAKTVLDVLVKE